MPNGTWTVAILVLLAGTAGAARAADKPGTGGGKAGDTGACYIDATAACWENHSRLMCTGEKFSPGAACPTADRAGTCTTGEGKVVRLYKKLYTAQNATPYCSVLGGRFEPG